LWHSGTTGNRLELGFGCFGKFVMEKAKGMIENADCGAVVNALSGSLL
jgi:hypothetical protein